MATVLLVWELGGGMGHLAPLGAVGQRLVLRGHRVVAAVRDLNLVRTAFAKTNIRFLPAPIRFKRIKRSFDPPRSYAHLLSNIGFGSPDELETLLLAWDTLFESVRPDLVVADHSPTALLSLRSHAIKRVTFGNGFVCPPDVSPLPAFERPGEMMNLGELASDEATLLHQVNEVLLPRTNRPLDRLAQIYHEVDETFLTTYQELDHFPARRKARYWGICPSSGLGAEPMWPDVPGSRIFAYLKPFAALEGLLDTLHRSRLPTIIVGDGISPSVREGFAGPTLYFSDQLMDMARTMQDCDLTVLNAGHGTTAAALMAGKPCLLFPLHIEQYLLAKQVERLGAGRIAPLRDLQAIQTILQDMLGSERYSERAQAFAKQHARTPPESRVCDIVNRIEELLSEGVRS